MQILRQFTPYAVECSIASQQPWHISDARISQLMFNKTTLRTCCAFKTIANVTIYPTTLEEG